MKSNRHVPLIIGALFCALAVYLAVWVGGFLGIFGATACTLLGWPTLKTGLFASNDEIAEMTSGAELSEETKKRFQDRI